MPFGSACSTCCFLNVNVSISLEYSSVESGVHLCYFWHFKGKMINVKRDIQELGLVFAR